MPQTKRLYKVRFLDQTDKKPIEVVVESVGPSEILGLVTLENFVFRDNAKQVILPEEEAARTRFGKTDRLHIPYHSIVYMEEFVDQPVDLKNLPFIKEVPSLDGSDEKTLKGVEKLTPRSKLKLTKIPPELPQ